MFVVFMAEWQMNYLLLVQLYLNQNILFSYTDYCHLQYLSGYNRYILTTISVKLCGWV